MRALQVYAPALLALALCLSSPAQAQDAESTAYYSVGLGYYDVIDAEDTAGELRFEYRSGTSFLADDLHPWAGVEVNSDASLWAGVGLYYDWELGSDFYLVPSFGAGYYARGGSKKDLDYPLEFRSQLEAAYQLEDKSRVGLAFGHISNASLGDKNPGTEILNLYYHVPTDNFF
jgi:hypothetical protein